MTRSFAAARLVSDRAPCPVRDPSITRVSFTCFRLEAIHDAEPDEPAFEVVELLVTPNVMGAFMRLR